MQIILSFEDDWRLLKKHIKGLLFSGFVREVKRFNYVKSYSLLDKKLVQKDQKLILVIFDEWNFEKLKQYVAKNGFWIVSKL